MKERDWIMLAVALLTLAFLRRKVDWGTGWVWPVPSILHNGRRYNAVISQESHEGHNGVDIAFRRVLDDGTMKEFPPGTAGGTPRHFTPVGVPILAAKAGTVWSVAKGEKGWEVVISHGKPFATEYLHLSSVALGPHKNGVNTATGQPTTVVAGQPIGFMGGDPMEATHFRHLHFEVWYDGGRDHAVSPDDAMATWQRFPTLFTL